MDPLSPETRVLLERCRRAEQRVPEVRDRIWGRVRRTLAGGMVAGTVASSVTAKAGASGTAAGTTFVLWLGVGLVTGSVVLGGVHVATHSSQQRAGAPTPSVSVASAPAPIQLPPSSTVPSSNPTAAPAPSVAPSASAAAAPAPKRPSGPASFSEETRLLQAARRALGDEAPDEALATLERYQQHHAQGVLREEAQATRVLALCAAGRNAEARDLADDFERSYPESPLLPRVQQACATPIP